MVYQGIVHTFENLSIQMNNFCLFFIQRFHYPLIVVVCHMFFKYFIAVLIRAIYRQYTGKYQCDLN